MLLVGIILDWYDFSNLKKSQFKSFYILHEAETIMNIDVCIKLTLFCLVTSFLSIDLFAKSPERDHELNVQYQSECLQIQEFLVGQRYSVDCFFNYHHFNSRSAQNHYRVGQTVEDAEIKLSTFNLWHPGSLRSAYKDYRLVAKIINQWDVVAATELIGVVGQEAAHNQRLLDFLEQAPLKLRDIEEMLEQGGGDILELTKRAYQLKRDLDEAPSLFRAPGYFLLLEELRRLDPSWALIMTPRGDAALEQSMHELTGFFYRGRRVRPRVNPHCLEFGGRDQYGKPLACYPNLSEEFMGRETNGVFARRPFVGSFESGNFHYNLISSHVTFGSPSDPEEMANILLPTFGVTDYRELGVGANAQTYRRFAEMKVTLELMDIFRDRYNMENIIYLGDTNLPARNQFWSVLLEDFPGMQVIVDEPTTVSVGRYLSDGHPTNGAGNDYDHFILRPEEVTNCQNDVGEVEGHVFYYHKEEMTRNYIRKNYLIRDYHKGDLIEPSPRISLRDGRDYEMIPKAYKKINRHVDQMERLLLSRRTVNNNLELVWDDYRFDLKLQYFRSRVFMDQLLDRFFYRVYMETISDHYPIWMSCRTY